jgi:hypothetical protein
VSGRIPTAGDVKLVSDGLRHEVLVWTSANEWERLQCVAAAEIVVLPNEAVALTLRVEPAFLDLVGPGERQKLALLGLTEPLPVQPINQPGPSDADFERRMAAARLEMMALVASGEMDEAAVTEANVAAWAAMNLAKS